MLNWINTGLGKIGDWLGSGAKAFFGWLFNGIGTILSAIFDGLTGIFSVFDAVWGFLVGIKDCVLELFQAAFPMIPAPVFAVLSAALLVVIVMGVIRLIRGKR